MKTKLENGYLIKPISSFNHDEIKHLYDLCCDYHIMCTGVNATDEDVDRIFEYNDKKTLEDSLTLGVYNNLDLLIGMVDIFKNYPCDGTWMIGLLLLAPDERNKKLGKIIHEKLKKYALNQGANILRIGVLAQNTKGLRFWEALGYKKLESKTINMLDKKSELYILSLKLK